jgi:GH25 family lysozyme M1 (1,4-beta-N-acetylmuramidase)
MNNLERIAMCLAITAPLLAAPSGALAQRVAGIDVSQFQGNMNWDTAWSQGVQFAFIRASRGGTSGGPNPGGFFNDTEFTDNVNLLHTQATRASNPHTIYNGFYHYARPDLIAVSDGDNVGSTDLFNSQPSNATILASAQDEAQHFYSIVGSHLAPGGADVSRRLRPVLDLEEWGGTTGADPSADQLNAANLSLWAKTFLNTFQTLSNGVRPMIYMSGSPAGTNVNSTLASETFWVANWTNNPNFNPGTGVFSNWSFYQYSSLNNHLGNEYGAGVSDTADIDLDVAHGDINFVRSFLIPEPGSATLALATLAFLTTTRRRRR